jgi:uncharacterized protein with ParB-like and HNH nuclease domain
MNSTPVVEADKTLGKELDLYPIDYPFEYLAQRINEKKLILDPEFQRKYVWDKTRQSQFIESCLMRIPLPACYFSEVEKGGGHYVIDGIQRLYTIKRFFSDSFELQGLRVYEELNGKKFSELDADIQDFLKEYTIRCIVLRKSNPKSIVNEIFARLNKGGVHLTDQEIRHAIYPGSLDKLLRELSKSPYIQKLSTRKSRKIGPLSPEEKKIYVRKRKEDTLPQQEIVLRFFAFYYQDLTRFENLTYFLDEYMRDNQDLIPEKIHEMELLFKRTLNRVVVVFGEEDLFKNLGKDHKLPSTAIYDMVMYVFAQNEFTESFFTEKADEIKSAFRKFCQEKLNQDETKYKLSGGTQDKSAIIARRTDWLKEVKNLFGQYVAK